MSPGHSAWTLRKEIGIWLLCCFPTSDGLRVSSASRTPAHGRWCTQELAPETPPSVLSKGLADFLQDNQADRELLSGGVDG